MTTWLRQHPGAEIVSRDRGGIYAEATRKAAPAAVQVAGRWHLLRNLSEALTHALAPYHRLFTQVARGVRMDNQTPVPRPCLPGGSASSWRRELTGNDELNVGNKCGSCSKRELPTWRSAANSTWIIAP